MKRHRLQSPGGHRTSSDERRGGLHTWRPHEQTSSRDPVLAHLPIHSCPWTLTTQNLFGGLRDAPEIPANGRRPGGCGGQAAAGRRALSHLPTARARGSAHSLPHPSSRALQLPPSGFANTPTRPQKTPGVDPWPSGSSPLSPDCSPTCSRAACAQPEMTAQH